jgi:Zn-dependent protease with chaperone function
LGFGAGLAPQGERVPFELGPDHVVLWPDSPRARSFSYESIRLEPGGFDREQFQLTWREDGTPWALALDDPALTRLIRRDPPSGLRAEVTRLDTRLKRGRVMRGAGWAILVGAVLLPITLLFALWWQADRIIDAAVARIPPVWEERLGDATYAQMAAESTVVVEGPAVAAVEEIGRRLTSDLESRYTFRWHVFDEPHINAFALPGGHVVVYTGLMRTAESADEVAGVLAHEVQHVLLRHSLRGVVRALGWRAVLSILLGDMGTLSGVGEMAAHFGNLKFGREQETAADVDGVALLRRARIDPDGMVRFFETLARQGRGVIPFLSTHPMSRERAARLTSEIARLGAWTIEPLAVDWSKVHASLGGTGDGEDIE